MSLCWWFEPTQGPREAFPCNSAMCPQTSEFNLRGTCPRTFVAPFERSQLFQLPFVKRRQRVEGEGLHQLKFAVAGT